MRTLSATLEAGQKQTSFDAVIKIAINSDAYTYEEDRLLSCHIELEPYDHQAWITLNDDDGVLNALTLFGMDAVISIGVNTSAGKEYSAYPPFIIYGQQDSSSPGKLSYSLYMKGVPNQLAEDKASESYQPESDNTDTIKDIINAIAGATMTCFNHCTAVTVDWDDEDALIDVVQPKDSFRVYTGDDRLTKIRELLEYTNCQMLVKADGDIHIIQPTTAGVSYDYEYDLADGEHTFFNKSELGALVVPNKITVQSQPDDDPQYSGSATSATSYGLLPKEDFIEMRLASNAQATSIAEAMIAGAELWADSGHGNFPINVGAEVFDYIKVTDPRKDDSCTGNIGKITIDYEAYGKAWNMALSFGQWKTVPLIMQQLGLSVSELEKYFSRLKVKNLYAENILAENLDIVWVDSDGNIDLSQIGDTLDNLADGSTYGRVLLTHLDASGLKITSAAVFESGYDPTDKFDLTGNDLDDVQNGSTYARVQSAALTAGGLVLLDQVSVGTYGLVLSTDISSGHILLSECVASGEWYDESGVEINASNGINIYGTANALTTRATKSGTIQCYVGADGAIYAGAGNIKLDADGIFIYGTGVMKFYSGATHVGTLGSTANDLYIGVEANKNINYTTSGTGRHIMTGGTRISTYLKIPVGSDLYE